MIDNSSLDKSSLDSSSLERFPSPVANNSSSRAVPCAKHCPTIDAASSRLFVSSRFFSSRIFVVASLLSLVGLVGCASDEAAKKPDPAPTEDSAPTASAPAPAAEPAPAPVETAPAPAPEPKPEPKPAAAPKPEPAPAPEPKKPDPKLTPAQQAAAGQNVDGIDDSHPVPTKKGNVKSEFDQAAATARTDPKSAAAKFAAVAKKNDYFYAAWFNAGTAAEAAGDNAAAERYYRDALKVRPDYGAALTNLFMLLNRTGKASAANKVVDEALTKHSNRAGPHLAAAMRAYVARQPEIVKQEALAAIRIDERQVAAMRLMGWVFFEEGKYETARFAVQNALKLEPGNALLHLDLGHALLKLKEPEKAEESFRKAVLLRPALAEAQENFGVLALKAGNKESALKALQEAAKLRPKSAQAQMHLANAERANGKYKEAELAYAQALKLDATLTAVHYNLGVMYLDNEIPGLDLLARLEKSTAELSLYVDKANPSGELGDKIDGYQKSLKKKIKRERKKKKRASERQALDEEKKKSEEAEEAKPKTPPANDGKKADAKAPPAKKGDAVPASPGNSEAADAVEPKEGDEK